MRSKLFESAYMIIGKIIDATIMFIFNIMAAKWIGIEGYGTYVYISAFVMLLSIALKMGLGQGVTVLIPRYDSRKDKAIIVGTAIIILYTVVVIAIIVTILFANPIANYLLNDIDNSHYLRAYIPILFMLPMTQMAEGVFRSFYHIKHYVIAKNILMPLGIIIGFLVTYFFTPIRNTELLFISNYIGFGFAFVYIIIAMLKFHMIEITLSRNLKKVGTLLALSVPLIFLGLHEYLIGRVDAYIIGYFVNESAVGVYNIAEKVAYIGTFMYVAVGSIAAPEISKLYHEGNIIRLKLLYKESTKWLVIVNTLVFFEIAIFAKWFMGDVTGGSYSGYWLLIVLSGAYLIHSFFGPVAYMNSMMGGHHQELKISLIIILGNIVFDIILYNILGIIGIALATVIVFICGSIYRMVTLRKVIGMGLDFNNARGIAIGLLLWLVLTVFVQPSQLINLIIVGVVFGFVYVTLVFMLMLSKDNRQYIINNLRHILIKD